MTEKESKIQMSRRQLLQTSLALAASGVVAACGSGAAGIISNGNSAVATAASMSAPTLPDPALSGIDHVVMVVMENRSFDHYLGWVPGADGAQAGLSYVDAFGKTQPTFRLSVDPAYGFQACGKADPDHSYSGGRIQYNNGKLDGWLRPPDTAKTNGDLFPIGYYTQDDLPFFKACAANWTICDSYHCGIMAETYPNRFYLLAGETDRMVNDSTISQLPTIFDRFNAKGLNSKYYFSDIPFTALFGNRLLQNSLPYSAFLADAAAGQLPAFSFIDPRFAGESPEGVSGDDHPNSDIRNGQAFLDQVYHAVSTGPGWGKTLLIITYDEWGGFYDHVVPFKRPISHAEAALGNDGLLGYRVPLVLIGPSAQRGHVSHWGFDPSSIHRFLAWRFGIDPLGVRGNDSATNNLAYALDFTSPTNVAAPTFNVPTGPFGGPCQGSTTSTVPGLDQVAALAAKLGFPKA